MSNYNADRPAWERDNGKNAPISYRLPPPHDGPLMGGLPAKKVKAGCWSTALLLLALALLTLALLGCGLAEGVREAK